MARCPKCQAAERVAGQAWCRGCLTAYQRARRAARRTTPLERQPASACPKCARRAAAAKALLAEFAGDPAVRQALQRVPGWGGFWMKVEGL